MSYRLTIFTFFFFIFVFVLVMPLTVVHGQGSDWDSPSNISNSVSDSTVPWMTVDPAGGVHIVWVEKFQPGSPAIMYSRIEDRLTTNPVDIQVDPGISGLDQPNLVCDSRGYLHLVYSAFGMKYSSAFAGEAESASSWSEPLTLALYENYMTAPSLAVGPDESLHLVFAIQVGSRSGIYYLVSDDHGVSWTAPQLIYENSDTGRLIEKPMVAVDSNNTLHLVYRESDYPETFPPLGLRYLKSTDGIIWSNPINLVDGPYDFPHIMVASGDEIHIVFSGTQSDRYKFHIQSQDGGQTWSQMWRNPDLGGLQGYPSLAEDSIGRLYWLQVGEVFNRNLAGGSPQEKLFMNVLVDNKWSLGSVLLERTVPEQHAMYVSAGVGLGNELHVVVSSPMRSGDGGYQFEILYLFKQLDSPSIAPQLISKPTAIPLPSPTPNLSPSATVTPFAFPKESALATQSATVNIAWGVIPAGLMVVMVLVVILRNKRWRV